MLKARGLKLNTPLGAFEAFLLGALSNAISTCSTYPFDVARMVQQSRSKGKQKPQPLLESADGAGAAVEAAVAEEPKQLGPVADTLDIWRTASPPHCAAPLHP